MAGITKGAIRHSSRPSEPLSGLAIEDDAVAAASALRASLLPPPAFEALAPVPGATTVRGSWRADDLMYFGIESVALFGFRGNDAIYGDAGWDWLEGGAGDDFIAAGAGNDVIWGGAGADYIRSGTGADTFIFVQGEIGTAGDLPNPVPSPDVISDPGQARLEGQRLGIWPAPYWSNTLGRAVATTPRWGPGGICRKSSSFLQRLLITEVSD